MVYDYGQTGYGQTSKKSANVAVPGKAELPTAVSKSSAIVNPQTASAYVPGNNIDSAKVGLANAKAESKVSALASAAQPYLQYRSNPQEDVRSKFMNALEQNRRPDVTAKTPQTVSIPSTETDYAAEILRLMSQPATRENQTEIAELNRIRNWKMSQNPDSYTGKKNDDISQGAEQYIRQIIADNNNSQQYMDSMRNNAENRYNAQIQQSINQLESQRAEVQNGYADLRKNALLSAARNSLGAEETLAAQGLGRGISNRASSGFGESSRLMAATSLNNSLSNAYLGEQTAIDALVRQQNDNKLQAYLDYMDRATDVDKTAISQANADRDYMYNVDNANAQLAQSDRNIEIAQQNADTQLKSVDNQEKQFNLQLAQDWNKHQDEMSLNLKQLEEVRRHNLADESLSEKQLAVDKAYKEGLITIQQYEAESGRISANASMLNAQKKTNFVSSGGNVIYSGGDASYASNGSNITLSDSEAGGVVRQYAQSDGKTGALYALDVLRSNGQISAIAAQNLVDELGLNKNDGWLK